MRWRRHKRQVLRRVLLAVGLGWAFVVWPGAMAAMQRVEQGLLWQVSRPGVPPSYVFGTLHLPDSRLLLLPDVVEQALARAHCFVMEMYPDEFVAARFREASQLDNGERLDHLLAGQDFATLAHLLEPRGFGRDAVAMLKPWAALLVLTARTATDSELTLDNALYLKARMARMRIEELDSVEEQIAVFDSIPRATQLSLLQFYIDHRDELPQLAERTVQAYLRRDLSAVARASQPLHGKQSSYRRHSAVLEKKIVRDRSVVMAHRMQTYLQRGRAVVAIGAYHLYGRHSVLRLLQREYGWQVTRVY